MNTIDNIRNFSIIAHIDHGKSTIADRIIHKCGGLTEREMKAQVLDSMDIERERGITILAKPASIIWKDSRINIIDTPGHRDFAAEVERVFSMADGALLLIDSAEGVMPQTKFVLSKALKQGLKPIVVINKLDKTDQRANEVKNSGMEDLEEGQELEFEIVENNGKTSAENLK